MGRIKDLKYIDDETVMKLISNGDKEAFSEIYNRYHGKMLNYFYRMLYRNEEKARDMTHDLFVKIIERPLHFNTEKRFSSWLYAVAANMCKNEYRSQAVRENGNSILLQSAKDTGSENMKISIDQERFKQKLGSEIDKLNPQQKNAFLLRFEHDMSIKEIAETMNCSEGTIKSRIFYSLKKMAEKLKAFNPHE